ncbi:uncharacterized protein GLRG_10923 [Colletotrichum graminicola M1.001]|uniref:Zn(2)-C6 fungal-type domain-containing protein n=1 Tax=Colletotrichum graminicola (strain M1.001 / M2 / FGSC 10212) TaxID=645133 RepID=E3QY30_COLGM|nr:uncharacterized protein GLRG_10923 [Colletotrichum graminicola M1.001]EFQ35768.1 hypothetical protein GLRG_10923 [Colletotrichum graminicola M1.001]
MARKGNRKARTGCITCKIRRVKCDEAKPSCNRCTAAGRRCDGYIPASSSEPQHCRPYRVFPGASKPGEGRALQYFCQEAAPFMSGAIGPQFWPKLVMQFASIEPAARHAVISISSIAEWLQHRTREGEQLRIQDADFALQHYNAAIHDLRSMKLDTLQQRQPVVLLVCLLFITVELIQRNRDAAMTHCKHGFQLMKHTVTNYAWTREHLLPLFKRVSVVAFVHGDNPEAFPDLQGLEHPMPTSFMTMCDAQVMIDDILIRTLRLVRNGDIYRRRPEKRTLVPPKLLAEQARLEVSLDIWKSLYDDYRTRPSSPVDEPSQQVKKAIDILNFFLSLRYESCRIWLNTAFGGDDYDYSKHLEAYKTVFAKIGTRSHQAEKLFAGDVYFTIDVGYFPSISLVMTKCYHLESRLRSLGMMPLPGLPKENLCLSAKIGGCKVESAELIYLTAHGP